MTPFCKSAGSLTYAEAQESDELSNWVSGHVHVLVSIFGFPEVIFPDNTKTGVTSACSEPELDPTYQAPAEFHRTAVLPTRVQTFERQGQGRDRG